MARQTEFQITIDMQAQAAIKQLGKLTALSTQLAATLKTLGNANAKSVGKIATALGKFNSQAQKAGQAVSGSLEETNKALNSVEGGFDDAGDAAKDAANKNSLWVRSMKNGVKAANALRLGKLETEFNRAARASARWQRFLLALGATVAGLASSFRLVRGAIRSLRRFAGRAFRRMTADVVQFGSAVRRSLRDAFTRVIKGFAIAIPAAIALSVRAFAKFERLQFQIRAVSDSAAQAAVNFRKIVRFSDITPFNVEELVSAAATLRSFGISGIKPLENIAGAAFATGRRIEDLVLAVGSLETTAFIRFGIDIDNSLQRAGIATVRFKDKTGRELKLVARSYDELREKVISAFGIKFGGSLEEASQTVSGLFSTIVGKFNLALSDIGRGLSSSLKNAQRDLISLLDEIRSTPALVAIGRGIGKAIDGIVRAIKSLDIDFESATKRFLKAVLTAKTVVENLITRLGSPDRASFIIEAIRAASKLLANDFIAAAKFVGNIFLNVLKAGAAIFKADLLSVVEKLIKQSDVEERAAAKAVGGEGKLFAKLINELSTVTKGGKVIAKEGATDAERKLLDRLTSLAFEIQTSQGATASRFGGRAPDLIDKRLLDQAATSIQSVGKFGNKFINELASLDDTPLISKFIKDTLAASQVEELNEAMSSTGSAAKDFTAALAANRDEFLKSTAAVSIAPSRPQVENIDDAIERMMGSIDPGQIPLFAQDLAVGIETELGSLSSKILAQKQAFKAALEKGADFDEEAAKRELEAFSRTSSAKLGELLSAGLDKALTAGTVDTQRQIIDTLAGAIDIDTKELEDAWRTAIAAPDLTGDEAFDEILKSLAGTRSQANEFLADALQGIIGSAEGIDIDPGTIKPLMQSLNKLIESGAQDLDKINLDALWSKVRESTDARKELLRELEAGISIDSARKSTLGVISVFEQMLAGLRGFQSGATKTLPAADKLQLAVKSVQDILKREAEIDGPGLLSEEQERKASTQLNDIFRTNAQIFKQAGINLLGDLGRAGELLKNAIPDEFKGARTRREERKKEKDRIRGLKNEARQQESELRKQAEFEKSAAGRRAKFIERNKEILRERGLLDDDEKKTIKEAKKEDKDKVKKTREERQAELEKNVGISADEAKKTNKKMQDILDRLDSFGLFSTDNQGVGA